MPGRSAILNPNGAARTVETFPVATITVVTARIAATVAERAGRIRAYATTLITNGNLSTLVNGLLTMTRSRAPHGTGGTPTPPRHGSGEGDVPSPRRRVSGEAPTDVARAQETTAEVARQGRPGTAASRGGAGDGSGARTPVPDDPALREIMDRYERLGDEPPTFDIAENDAVHGAGGAHTLERHGPDLPLARDPSTRTVEGRIYGDPPWGRPENWSYRWADPSTMNRAINDYVRQNWEAIRSDLAVDGAHNGSFDARQRVGQGYYNSGMYGAGPRNSQYAETSFATIRIRLVPGSDPPEPFIVTAFPSGLL